MPIFQKIGLIHRLILLPVLLRPPDSIILANLTITHPLIPSLSLTNQPTPQPANRQTNQPANQPTLRPVLFSPLAPAIDRSRLRPTSIAIATATRPHRPNSPNPLPISHPSPIPHLPPILRLTPPLLPPPTPPLGSMPISTPTLPIGLLLRLAPFLGAKRDRRFPAIVAPLAVAW